MCARHRNIMSESCNCDVGVRQSENLSPLLFSKYLNDVKMYLSDTYAGLKIQTSTDDMNIHMHPVHKVLPNGT